MTKPDVLISTIDGIERLKNKNLINFDSLTFLVIDEIDTFLDCG